LEDADIIICPIPFSRDGIKVNGSNIYVDDLITNLKGKILVSGSIKEDVINKLKENNIDVIDILKYEEFSIKNAVATSEGAIKKAIEMTSKTLNNSNILILGYGRIGKCLARNLSGFGSKIYCEARKSKDIALINSIGYNEVDLKDLDEVLPKMDIIFNTIPSMILDKKRVELLKQDACVIDLASIPGGVDFEELSKRNINTCWYLSVPSKDSPYSAALYIKETLDNIVEEYENG
jgi:dipicolinate synthase subunit A